MATVAKNTRSTTGTVASATPGPFSLGFRLFSDDAVKVYVNGIARTDWTLTSAYSNGYDDAATILFDVDLASADAWVIEAAQVPWRQDDYVNGDPHLVSKINAELANHASMLSELRRDSDRSLRIFEANDPVIAVPGTTVIFDDDGLPAIGPTTTEISNAQSYSTAASASAAAAAASEANANADAIATAADRVQTGLDAAATAADVLLTAADVVSISGSEAATAADVVLTHADAAATAADAIATAADRVQTGLDAVATAADVVTVTGIYDSFDDRYLGAKATEPALDNDGNALLTGALYFNTATDDMWVYTGAAWVAAYASLGGALVPADIGVTVQGYDAALASLAGLTLAADKGLYATAADTLALFTLTAAGRALLDDADAAAQRLTLGLGTAAVVDVIDEDSFATDSPTRPPSQQSVKAYVAASIPTPGMSFIATADLSSVAVADFTLPAGYDAYMFVLQNVLPATNTVTLAARVSTDGGSTFKSDSNYIAWNGSAYVAATMANILTGVGNGAGYGVSGEVLLPGPGRSSQTNIIVNVAGLGSGAGSVYPATYGVASAVNAIRFLFSSGNLASGTITLYGMANA